MTGTKLKIGLMSSQSLWGGGEQFIWSLGKGLIARGHQVTWFADADSPLARRIKNADFDLFKVPSRGPTAADLVRIRRISNKRGIEIFHANDTHALSWSSLALLGKSNVKRVGVKHTAFPIRSAARYNWMVDSLACVSQSVRKMCIESGIQESKTTVIHGGVEMSHLTRAEARFSVCKDLGISPNIPVFSAVGSLQPCKSYHLLVEAAKSLRWKLADFRVVICGEGSERSTLEKMIKLHGLEKQVHLLGFQKDPAIWIAGSDAFVHPSVSEGLSLVAIQSQMLGVPVIARDCDGLSEVMRNPFSGNELGWIIQNDSPEGMADQMVETLHNTEKRYQIVKAARLSACDRFHSDRMVEGFERLYSRLIGANDFAVKTSTRCAAA